MFFAKIGRKSCIAGWGGIRTIVSRDYSHCSGCRLQHGNIKLVRVSHGVRLWVDRTKSATEYHIESPGISLWKDTFDDLEEATSAFDKIVESIEEQRLAISSVDMGADTHLALRMDLEQRGGLRSVWGVLREDSYETVFGDGYYAYLEAAFDTQEEAVAFAADNQERSVNWHIREYELRLIDGEPIVVVVAPSKPIERHPWGPGTVSFVPTAEQEPINIDILLDCWAGDAP
jgi:hypothetical protein